MTPRRQRILVVDDNDAGRYATGRVLRQAGFEIAEAGTGGDALKRTAQDRPDLVVLDVRLPDIPGVEVCRRIKTSPEVSSTLVLQMSASAIDDGSRVAALECGADAYIASPVEPAVLVATVRSLLRIRTAEQALQDAALEWQATFDAIRDGVAVLDVNGVVQRSNAALPALLGLERREIAGRNLDELIPPAEGDPPLVEVLESRHRTNAERALGERSFSITIDPMADAADKLRGGVAIVTDITERKRVDRQLQHSQKLESIGLLAGGVAHDFNNLLVGILGNASLALDSLEDPEATRRLLQDVMGAGERAAELTRQMLAYAGKGRLSVGPVDLSALIRDLAPLIQSSIPRNVRLTLDLRRDLPAIQADKTQIEQLAMNLIINAAEANQGNAGAVTVTTASRNVSAAELGAFLTEQKKGGDYVVLEVRDTGTGMDQETLKRIFDPFFSTKFLGRGLGLSAALGIIRGHKGALKVTSAPAQGTVFEVLFPAAADAPVRPASREEAALARGRGAVLVVDDEEIVRNMAQKALTRAGYEVLLAGNGAEALAVFSRNVRRISLVLLDLVMPVMSGEEALPHLLSMNPDAPVIVSSGHGEEECRVRLKEPRVAGFLQKPYTAASLAAKVHAVLGAAAAGKVEVQ
ncbi:MAG: response regulator [Bryobacteraceae bacterium]|jgi:PAS domain S-box-containing protein